MRHIITGILLISAALLIGNALQAEPQFKQAGELPKPSKQSSQLHKPHDFFGIVESPAEDDPTWVCWVHSDTGC